MPYALTNVYSLNIEEQIHPSYYVYYQEEA